LNGHSRRAPPAVNPHIGTLILARKVMVWSGPFIDASQALRFNGMK
jgi:hypothetical protein